MSASEISLILIALAATTLIIAFALIGGVVLIIRALSHNDLFARFQLDRAGIQGELKSGSARMVPKDQIHNKKAGG